MLCMYIGRCFVNDKDNEQKKILLYNKTLFDTDVFCASSFDLA